MPYYPTDQWYGFTVGATQVIPVGQLYTSANVITHEDVYRQQALATVTAVQNYARTYVTDPFWQRTATTSSGITFNDRIWTVWNDNPQRGQWSTVPLRRSKPAEVVDPAVVARDRLITNNRMRSAELRRKVAERKADELLKSQLSPEQLADYERLQHFHVIADGKVYRLRRAWAGNIDLIEEDKVVERWCVHPSTSIPVPDSLLAQKLMLECGQAADLRRIANVERLPLRVA